MLASNLGIGALNFNAGQVFSQQGFLTQGTNPIILKPSWGCDDQILIKYRSGGGGPTPGHNITIFLKVAGRWLEGGGGPSPAGRFF